MGEQEDTGLKEGPGGMGGCMDSGLAVGWMSGRDNMWDTGSVRPERGGGTDGGSGSVGMVDGRGSGQLTDGGSRPDLCDPADREERTDISPPVKSTLGLVGMYPLVGGSHELNKLSGGAYGWFLEIFGETC